MRPITSLPMSESFLILVVNPHPFDIRSRRDSLLLVYSESNSISGFFPYLLSTKERMPSSRSATTTLTRLRSPGEEPSSLAAWTTTFIGFMASGLAIPFLLISAITSTALHVHGDALWDGRVHR